MIAPAPLFDVAFRAVSPANANPEAAADCHGVVRFASAWNVDSTVTRIDNAVRAAGAHVYARSGKGDQPRLLVFGPMPEAEDMLWLPAKAMISESRGQVWVSWQSSQLSLGAWYGARRHAMHAAA